MWTLDFRPNVININNSTTFISLYYPERRFTYEEQSSMFVDGGINTGTFVSTSSFTLHVWTREFLSRSDPNFNEGDRHGPPMGTLDIRGQFGSFTQDLPFEEAVEMMKFIKSKAVMG
jgi:hypothetical protein